MKFIDFFSGVGGFRRGMELAGHERVGFCEFDKFAVASYTAMHLMTDDEREYISTLPKNKRVAEADAHLIEEAADVNLVLSFLLSDTAISEMDEIKDRKCKRWLNRLEEHRQNKNEN